MRSVAVSIGPGEGVEKPETPSKTIDWIAIALWVARGSGGGRAGTGGAPRALRRSLPGLIPSFAVTLPTAPGGRREPHSRGRTTWRSTRRGLGDRVREGLEQLAARPLVRAWSHLPRGVCALEVRQLLEQRLARELVVAKARSAPLLASRAGDEEPEAHRARRERRGHEASRARRREVVDADRERRELRVVGAQPPLGHQKRLPLLVVAQLGLGKVRGPQLDVGVRGHHHARDGDVGRKAHVEVDVLLARPRELPAKLDRVPARRERPAELCGAARLVDALIAHRRLRVEGRETF